MGILGPMNVFWTAEVGDFRINPQSVLGSAVRLANGAKTEVGGEIGSVSARSHFRKKASLSPALVTLHWDNSSSDSGWLAAFPGPAPGRGIHKAIRAEINLGFGRWPRDSENDRRLAHHRTANPNLRG
jgi:hypothetical protein